MTSRLPSRCRSRRERPTSSILAITTTPGGRRWVKQTLKITHFLGTSENAVRIQIAVALIAFLLLRLAHDAHKIVTSPLTFARLIRTNLMHRRAISELLQATPPPEPQQSRFDFG